MLVMADRLQLRWGVELELAEAQARDKLTGDLIIEEMPLVLLVVRLHRLLRIPRPLGLAIR